MELDQDQKRVLEDLQAIRPTFELRYNEKGKLVKAGSIDASGHSGAPVYEPRWELWDTDPQGAEYRVMQLQFPDGTFRLPGDWLVFHIQRIHPAHYGGDVGKMVRALIDEPMILRELGTKKDSDEAIDAAANWAAYVETPKSGAGLSFRGKRALSG